MAIRPSEIPENPTWEKMAKSVEAFIDNEMPQRYRASQGVFNITFFFNPNNEPEAIDLENDLDGRDALPKENYHPAIDCIVDYLGRVYKEAGWETHIYVFFDKPYPEAKAQEVISIYLKNNEDLPF
jgi:hypothetical protein